MFERTKVANFMSFLSAHGFSLNDVNAFVAEGKLAKLGHPRQVLDKSPMKKTVDLMSCPSTEQTFLGSHLIATTCVGETSGLEGVAQSRLTAPLKMVSVPSTVTNYVPRVGKGEIPCQQPEVTKSWCDIISTSSGKTTRTPSFL